MSGGRIRPDEVALGRHNFQADTGKRSARFGMTRNYELLMSVAVRTSDSYVEDGFIFPHRERRA